MNYNVIAGGDSFNDTAMLGEADCGILFHAPANVIEQFPTSRRRNLPRPDGLIKQAMA